MIGEQHLGVFDITSEDRVRDRPVLGIHVAVLFGQRPGEPAIPLGLDVELLA